LHLLVVVHLLKFEFEFDVRFYVPLDTRQVVSETFFPVSSWLVLKKLNLTQQHNKSKHSSGTQKYYNTKLAQKN